MMKKLLLPLLLISATTTFVHGMKVDPTNSDKSPLLIHGTFMVYCFKQQKDSRDKERIIGKSNDYILAALNEEEVENFGGFATAICKYLGLEYDVKKHFLSLDVETSIIKKKQTLEHVEINEDNEKDVISIDNILPKIHLTVLSTDTKDGDIKKIRNAFDKQEKEEYPIKKGLKIGGVILLVVAACGVVYYFFIRKEEELKVVQTTEEEITETETENGVDE